MNPTLPDGYRWYEHGDVARCFPNDPELPADRWPDWGCTVCGFVGPFAEVGECHPPMLSIMVVRVDASGTPIPQALPADSVDTVEQGLGIMTVMKRAATALGLAD